MIFQWKYDDRDTKAVREIDLYLFRYTEGIYLNYESDNKYLYHIKTLSVYTITNAYRRFNYGEPLYLRLSSKEYTLKNDMFKEDLENNKLIKNHKFFHKYFHKFRRQKKLSNILKMD